MVWHDVREKLPTDTVDGKEFPNYVWVLVTDGHGRLAIAQYREHFNDLLHTGELYPGWEFFGADGDDESCPYYLDCSDVMMISDIKFWLDPWPTLPYLEESNDL